MKSAARLSPGSAFCCGKIYRMENYDIPFYEKRKNALIEEIIAAFDGVSREGGVSMSEAEVIDDYGDAGERYMARQEDTDTRWEEITIEQLTGMWASIFLDSIGFRYYMPAFLLYFLYTVNANLEEDYDDEKATRYNHNLLIWQLTARDTEGKIEDHILSNFEIFNSAQGRAIAHYLQLDAEREDAWRIRYLAQLEAKVEFDEDDEEWKANIKEAEELAKLSPEELEELEELEAWKELEKRECEDEFYRAQHDSSYNQSRYALEKYWGRFL